MLKRLRRSFIIITMSLVGLVLVAVLGSSLVSTYASLHQTIDESLERGLTGELDAPPTIGGFDKGDTAGADRESHMLLLSIEVDATGTVLQSNSSVNISESDLVRVIDQAISSDSDSGTISDIHLAWKRMATGGGFRIAIVDTTTIDSSISNQLINDLGIIAVAMGVLLVITWFLSEWALAPVERSWKQQRRFVADASHELKTPLSVILANTQILRDEEKRLPSRDSQWIDSTAEEAERMKALVNDLLELARTDENKVGDTGGAFQAVDVDLSSIVDRVTLQFDAVAFERGCELESSIADGIHVTGDPSELEKLVKALVDNACKYARGGTPVSVTLSRSGSKARFVVSNLGVPIDPEDLPHVFERFYRSDKARTKSSAGGYGLGLAIAKGIVDAHHGDIRVTSTERDGTSFVVTL